MNEAIQREPVVASIVETPEEGVRAVEEAIVVDPSFVEVDLEERIRNLERLYHELKNSREIEERVAARVLERIPTAAAKHAPAAIPWYRRLNPFPRPSAPVSAPWVLFDLFADLRFAFAMMLDRRFAMSWVSRGLVAASLVVAFTTSFWLAPIGFIPLIGSTVQWFLGVLLTLVCGGLAFKVFHREAQRYRDDVENSSS